MSEPPHIDREDQSEGETNLFGRRPVAEVITEVLERRTALNAVFAEAQRAAGRVRAALRAGSAADSGDVHAITLVRHHLDQLAQLIAAADVPEPAVLSEPRTGALDAAIVALQQLAAAESDRSHIARFRGLSCLPGASRAWCAQAHATAALARELAELPPGAEVPAAWDGLLALGQLIDTVAAGVGAVEPEELLGLQNRATAGLPPALALLPVAALTGQLLWTTDDDAGPAEDAPRRAQAPAEPGSPGAGTGPGGEPDSALADGSEAIAPVIVPTADGQPPAGHGTPVAAVARPKAPAAGHVGAAAGPVARVPEPKVAVVGQAPTGQLPVDGVPAAGTVPTSAEEPGPASSSPAEAAAALVTDAAAVEPSRNGEAIADEPFSADQGPSADGPAIADEGSGADEESGATASLADAEPASGPDLQPDLTESVAELLAAGRFGLAEKIAAMAGWPDACLTALRLAALADGVRTETGPCAARLRSELAGLEAIDLTADPATMPLAVAALLRTALVVGEPTAGALLTEVSAHIEEHLGQIAEQVGRRALKAVLVGNPLRTVLADVTDLETRLRATREAARERLRPRTLRFKRASDIAQRWLSPTGLLGNLLTAVAEDNRAQAPNLSRDVVRLSDQRELSKEIDLLDEFRGRPAKRIQGPARQDLLSLAVDALAPVSAWLEVVDALKQTGTAQQTWVTAEITAMREEVRANAAGALEALHERASSDDPVAAGAATAARRSLQLTIELLEGSASLPPGEQSPDLVLSVELLKLPGATVDPKTGLVGLPASTSVAALVAAVTADWQAALDAQIATEHYQAARYLLALSRAGGLPSFSTGDGTGTETAEPTICSDAAQIIATAEERTRRELIAIRDEHLTALRRARLQYEVSEEQDSELTGLLAAADPARHDLAEVREQLRLAGVLLPRYRAEAAQRLRARLEALVALPPRTPVDSAHIGRLIDDGQLSTAEELIYFCEIGEPVPEPPRPGDLARFFPTVPAALPFGLTPDVLGAVREGGAAAACPVLDFSELSPDARNVIVDALTGWRRAGGTTAESRSNFSIRHLLVPALRLAGFEFEPSSQALPLDLPKSRERQFFELSKVSWNGRPMVPQFGSKLRGRLRILLCWSQPADDLLMSWVDRDTSGEAVLVVYFGTMSPTVRRRLAARAVHTDAPVAVLDDAALAYLAAHGDRQIDAAMSVLLPFSAVQPYVRHKRSLVAPEMFYGRGAERKDVLSPEGTQVIFGGRGLGKSALLRNAKATFEQEPERIAIHIELTTVDIGPGRQNPDAVWDVLLRELQTVGVIPSTRQGRRSGSSHQTVRTGVQQWLSEDSRRRLLILLDESDGFFECDAPRFLETNRLKDLGQVHGLEGRAKVVFAGLHSVQRFAKTSNNTFKHLAQRPTVIGPLSPQFAYDLISRPFGVLGFSFEDPDLVNRILAYCSYQPFLLQMFGHRLVQHMHATRSAEAAKQPPFVITRADVELVEGDPELKADIISTFRDTLNLDPRYNVIASVLAHQAHEHGMDARLTEFALRDECLAYWRDGFQKLDPEEFRAYLHEMVGLGILAPNNDSRGWHLRSPNVLRMVGNPDEVTAELLSAASESVPSEFIALLARRTLPDGRRAPLTAQQVDDLLGDHANQVRLVLGSIGTGVDGAADTVRAVCADLGQRYELVETRSRKQFEDALVDGRPGQRRVVLSDLAVLAAGDEVCGTALEAALVRLPVTPGVTRSVVLISGPEQLGFWQGLFATEERPGIGLVTLRKHDRRTLRVWSFDSGYFGTEDRQARLLEATGGWPILVERAATLAGEMDSEDAALDSLLDEMAAPGAAAKFIDAVGLTADPWIMAAFDDIVQLVGADSARHSDLIAAAGSSGRHPAPLAAVACLDALGVFDTEGQDAHRVNSLLVRCWPHRREPDPP